MNIKRKIREELNKTLLNEAPVCTVWMSEITWFDCPARDGGYGQGTNSGWMYVVRNVDCSWTTHTGGCADTRKPPREDIDMGHTMGESRGYRSNRTRR